MNRHRNWLKTLFLLALLQAQGVFASDVLETLEGRMTGLKCASKGKLCPTAQDDPHLMLERDFVMMQEDGRYFFITNMDRHTKLKFVLAMVRIKGQVSEGGSAITASELWVKEQGDYRLAWTIERARKRDAEKLRQRRQGAPADPFKQLLPPNER